MKFVEAENFKKILAQYLYLLGQCPTHPARVALLEMLPLHITTIPRETRPCSLFKDRQALFVPLAASTR